MSHEYLMRGLTIQHYRFTVLPLEPIVFTDQAGSALRGALYQALSNNFCSEPDGILTPDHAAHCPVCWLLAAEDQQAQRGQNVPRPLTVEPPSPHTYATHEHFTFGLTLIGKAQNLFPYLARAVQKMGQQGVGKGRGRFRLEMISEYTPLLDAERNLLNQNSVHAPTLQITPVRIAESSTQIRPDRITIELLTPLRLVANDHLVKTPDPVIFIQRLIERCQNLVAYYAESDTQPVREDWISIMESLKEKAARLRTGYDDTEWVDAWSGSKRKQGYTPIGGLMGSFRWEGDVLPLLPWLLWGQSLHIGKDAVKGNGWYRIVS